MVVGIWGQTRNSDDWTIDPADLFKRGSGDPSRPWHPEMGTDTMSGIPIRNVQRETFSSQLSTGCPKGRIVAGIWGQTRNLGDRTFWPGGPGPAPAGRSNRLGAKIWGQTRCPIYRSGTFNVKRSALNFQRGDRKGAWWSGYGDRHRILATDSWPRRTRPSAGRVVPAGLGTQIWGQTRCPIYWSGTFNVKRSTLNF